jgi:hypothetical protein
VFIRIAAVLFLLLVASPAALAQLPPGPEGVLQINDELSRFLERQQALGNLPEAHLGAQPLSAMEARRYLDSLALRPGALTATDYRLLRRLRREEPGPGVGLVRRHLPFLYQDGETFITVREDDYALHAEPLAYLSLGRARITDGGWVPYWQNTRGARVAGHLGNHLFFEGRLEENQWKVPFPNRVAETAERLPFVRDLSGAYDYMLATGLVGVRTKYVEARFGRDRNRWGYGTGSLALSNYAPVYDQLQIRTNVWRIQYTNLFTQFVDRRRVPESLHLPRKYGAFHRLAIHLPASVELEIFEQVIFTQDTTMAGARGGYELAYLNPIILYRAVEGDLGSADNMLLGAGAAWNAFPGFRLYGQFILDEFKAEYFFSEDWWANKWGYVLGTRVSDPGGIPNVDLQLEYARLRPFLYSHRSLSSAFVHQNDVLGHPAGPNAWDVSAFLRVRPLPEITGALDVSYTRRGRNPDGVNLGADPRESNMTRPPGEDFNHVFLQGVRQDYLLLEARAAYEILPSLFGEATLRAESLNDAENGLRRYVSPYFSLRWGLPFQSLRW